LLLASPLTTHKYGHKTASASFVLYFLGEKSFLYRFEIAYLVHLKFHNKSGATFWFFKFGKVGKYIKSTLMLKNVFEILSY